MVDSLSLYSTGVELTAEVIDYSSYVNRDTRGNSITMHTPIVSFDYQGAVIEKSLDISSGNKPVIGEQITIFYDAQNEGITELSLGTILFMSVGLVFGIVILCPVIAAVQYACGYPLQKITRWLSFLLFKMVIPTAFLLFWGMLNYVLHQYFFTHQQDDLPTWAVIIIGFFDFVLLLTFISVVKIQRDARATK